MEPIFAVIEMDLEVAEKAVDEGDFQFVSVIGNRIMSNLLVAEKYELMIIGWLLRDLGLDLLSINAKKGKSKGQRSDEIGSAKKITKDYLKDVKMEIMKETIGTEILFDKYYILQSKIRKMILRDIERTSYNTQTEFSKLFATKMIDIFYSNKNILLTKQNNLLPTIAGELGRTSNDHGGKEVLYTYFIFKVFNDLYKYAYLELFFNDEKNKLWDTESKLNEYFDLIYEFKSKLTSSEPEQTWISFNNILSKIGLDFRIYYLNYSDIIGRLQVEVDSPRK